MAVAVASVLSLVFACAASAADSTAERAGAAATLKKCRQFTVLRVSGGRRTHVKVTKCVRVRSTACKVTWSKKRSHGRVVIHNRNPVWIARVACPASGATALAREASEVLALPQHAPADVDLFASTFLFQGVALTLRTEGAYAQGAAMAPAAGPAPGAAEIRAQLQQFLDAQLGSDKARVSQALGLYDSPAVQALIPDPKLRAALAGLTGTSLEPAIGYFQQNAAFFSATPPLAFGTLDSLTAPSETRHTAGHAQILINSRYASEPWQLLVALVGHELQHTQAAVSPADEAITNYELAVEYAEILATHPDLAYVNSELARRLNGWVMLLLNSRHPKTAQAAIVAPDGLGLFPGSSNPAKDVWGDYTGTTGGGTSPAPSEAHAVLARLLPGVALPTPLNYETGTAVLFQHLADPALSSDVLVRLSVLLQLRSVAEIASKLGGTQADAIKNFKLQPLLAIIAAGQHVP